MADQIDRLKSALADRYTIERELGSGGMATVYLAEDMKHHRKVAVKVLRPELAASLGVQRFVREVEIAANLNHPHVLPLHDSGEASGLLFYVMPYVEGETLRDRMNREGQLPIDDALQITREVAAALSYAHSQGVVHRDIKPENVLLSAGEAVVADFGIASAVTEAGEGRLTETGISVGTPAYMSPEQAAGGEKLDGRSDVYSLGCVLYEMLAGEPPYTGPTAQAIVAKKLSEPVPRVSVLRETVPSGVEVPLVQALAKAPADRLATAQQFVEALTTPGGDPTPGEAKPVSAPRAKRRNWLIVTAAVVVAVVVVGAALVIASSMASRGPELSDDVVVVLPFSNETGDAAHDVVGKILAVSIIERMERAEVGRVVPYGAINLSWEAALERRAREPAHDPRAALAAEFGAGTVVWGSVFPQRDSLRLEAEISSAGGSQLVLSIPRVVVASDGDMEGIEMVIESVTGAVAFHLDSAWGQRASTISPVSSFAVYEAYVRAQEAFWRDREEARREAERVLALDSTYLPAMTLLAVIHMNLGNLPAADSILNEAGESYDRMAPAEKGQWEWARATLDGDRQAAYRSMKEGNKRAPHPMRTLSLGFEALGMNYPAEALEVLSGADPDSPSMRIVTRYWPDLGAALHMLGDHKRELREVRRGRARHPDWGGVLMAEIGARAALGDVQQVTELVEEAIRKDAGPALAARVAALELRAHGHPEASRAAGERALAYLQDRPTQVAATASHRYDLLLALSVLERWDDAQAMAEELVREQPSNVDYLGSLGTLAARRGQREEARRIADRLAAMEIPYDDGGSTYNRACIAALLGEKDEAVSLLKLAHQQGLRFSVWFHIDPNLESLRGYPPFEEFMRPKG